MVTVADLLAEGELALAPLQLPAPAAEVRWVATSELVDPTPYLEGGEVLLTTGLETKGWRAEWPRYVDRLAGAGVAALGFAVGLTHERPPRLLVRACEDAGLNLFEVPRPTTFVAISRAIAGLLDAERENVARRSMDAQRVLTQAALEVEDEVSVVRRLAALVEGAAVTVTRDGVPVAGPFGPRTADLELDEVRTEVERIRRQGLRAAASASGAAGTIAVRPLGVRSRPEAWLAVFVPGRTGDVDRVAITTAVSLLGLGLERRRERRATDRELRARAVELLLADDMRTARIVLGAAGAAAGTGPRLPREVRMLRGRGPAEVLEDALTMLEEERHLVAVLEGELVAVSSARGAADIAQRLAERGLQVGVGRAVPVEQTATSHETAGHALAATGRAPAVRTWDDLADTGVVGLLGADRAAAFARSFLAPLADDPVLLETLAAFLRQHGSRGETAAELGVHRNTVRNRLEHIESLLGASLDDPRVRVDAWVALQVSPTGG
ncbi:PucR family transcriptional regulator [Nocardioides antri]|uniref:PucR family transcriptional regulator n=1 Tax=Nocardioides antri TaxID=2607659 RepID=A0A5B1M6F6_9ACTN|nr:PucR family transcriptional regulator [Nocardioides antri]KAA1427709.1 PucR family transcriptional regulator [Nocardioides antri]